MNRQILIILSCIAIINCKSLSTGDLKTNHSIMPNDSNSYTYPNITLDSLLNINTGSNGLNRIVIYSFRDYFNNPNWGATLDSDYYELMKGKKLNINNVPHIEITDSAFLKSFIISLNSLKYLGDNYSNYPIIPYSIKSFGLKPGLQLLPWNKFNDWSIKSMLLIYSIKKSEPDILINYENKIIYKGIGFKLTGKTTFEFLLDSLNYETPAFDYIYY